MQPSVYLEENIDTFQDLKSTEQHLSITIEINFNEASNAFIS